ncbi:MAG: site-specific DNA-methyltransferase [bacterium]
MKTNHQINLTDSGTMESVADDSIDLVVTSPPYPMIEMWDDFFTEQSETVREALSAGKGMKAFNRMHSLLEPTWNEIKRVVRPSGIVCVNVGDATRKIGGTFQQFPNHVRIIDAFNKMGFEILPDILWRKPTNSANKFMGSGMIPPNAYVTLEHEYILIFRKEGGPRSIESDKDRRYQSAYFWEERNKWFSDLWGDITGSVQDLLNPDLRERAAAFPLRIPYRLINMFSLQGDTVLDPFWGTGTTSLAAMVAARNSVGYELNENFIATFEQDLDSLRTLNHQINKERLENHHTFVQTSRESGTEFKYTNDVYETPVKTKQEKTLQFWTTSELSIDNNHYTLTHKPWKNTDSRQN